VGLDPRAVGPADGLRAIGILGGTFDPVHRGHIALGREALKVLELDEVLFVPNSEPPHKQGYEISAAEHREAMLAAALDDESDMRLSRIELERSGPSYAVDTVVAFAAESREAGRPEPFFILSADALLELDSWREPHRILELCRFAVAPRPGAGPLDAAWVSQHYPGLEDRFVFLAGPELDISATTIRERVVQDEPISDLVPATVEQYIEAHGLYREQTSDLLGIGAATMENPASVEQESSVDTNAPSESGAPDPRDADRPGLPASREAEIADTAAPTVIAGKVDESILALAHRTVELASDKKASDIVLLDVREQTTMTDYFVICSGASDRQLNAIADGIVEGTKADDQPPMSREGDASSHWLLVDYGGVIVHIMSKPEREFYQLEKLWAEASLLLRVL
jgi:nicotinate-nucleotide adenylyltransferase